ncbi:hypothetical protein CUMW_222430 [Citrus unshiu]|nr:hypothetical protein CUMW_222430 [Citrus unshiu]
MVGESDCELHQLKESELNLFSVSLVLKREELSLVQKSINKCQVDQKKKNVSEEIELKAMKLGEVQRSVEEREKQLALKESKISSIQSMIEEYEEEIKAKEKSCDEVKKEELSSIKNEIAEYSNEVELKRNELNLIQHAANKLQFDLIQTMDIGYLGELKEKEKLFDSLKKGLEDCFQDLELQVKTEEPENLTREGRNLQLLLNEHLQKHDLIFGKIFNTIKRARDPASLVLGAMSGFYPPHSRERDVEFQVGIIRSSCILLLEQLSTVAPEINAQVRDEALKVAGDWKKKMRVGPRKTPKLCQSLGFADKVTGPRRSTVVEGSSSLPMLVGISAHTYQPVPSPKNQPQHSGTDHSTSPFYPRVLLKLENHDNKHPRRESPTFRARTRLTPASVARSGGIHSLILWQVITQGSQQIWVPAQSNVAVKQNLYHFPHNTYR